MRKTADYRNLAYKMFRESAKRGLMHAEAEGSSLDGRIVNLHGKPIVNFGSCSYLGLEMDPRLKEGVIDAVTRYGTQFSASRGTMSSPPYAELEGLLGEIFGHPALLAPTTSLAHMAAFPVIADEDDAFVIDQQAHHSLQTATQLIRSSHCELLRHSRMDLLEERILELRRHYKRIWYVADSIYSMLGDPAPLEHLQLLMERYRQLHLYLDDAHGMGWCGKHGSGYVSSNLRLNERTVLTTSLAKAFGVGGGVLVVPDAELRSKIRTIGGPFVFSGPIQPPMLGAAIASARIHLSDEIYELQQALLERIRLANTLLREAKLPVVAFDDSPIRFIGTGLPRVTFNLGARLLDAGFYLLAAHFPVVPMKRSGLRFTVTLHHTPDDIKRLVDALAYHLPRALEEEEYDLDSVRRAFDLPPDFPAPAPLGNGFPGSMELQVAVSQARLHLEQHSTIETVDQAEWDALLADRGSFSWAGLRLLEQTFQNQARPEHNWTFTYYIVRDQQGKPVLATFFTNSLWKDDMIAREDVSRQLEERRLLEPYHMTSYTLSMGSWLTEGDHLYLDREADWRGALALVLKAAGHAQEAYGANTLVLRDLPEGDEEMDAFLLDQGFAKYAMPPSHVLPIEWQTEPEYVRWLQSRYRVHHLREVAPWNEAYEVEVRDHTSAPLSEDELAHLYGLYRNVQQRGLLINTFLAPEDLFRRAFAEPGWEILLLRLKPECGGPESCKPVAFVLSYLGREHYAPMLIGLAYSYVASHKVYRQALRHLVLRGQSLGKQRIHFGMGASLEKRRLGSKGKAHTIYFQAREHYQMEVLARMMEETDPKRS